MKCARNNANRAAGFTSVWISIATRDRLKQLAAARGQKIFFLVEKYLTEALDRESSDAKAKLTR
jgi:hypothetical protein